MQTIKLKGKEVKYYSSPDEMPIERFYLYNKHLLIDSGIGADLESIDNHIFRINQYISKGDKENALKQSENLRSSLYFVGSEFNPKFTSFACLVTKIGNTYKNDLSDDGLKRTLAELAELQIERGFLNTIIDEVKKKLKKS